MAEQLVARLQRRGVDALAEIGPAELCLTTHALRLIRRSSTIHSTRVQRFNKLRSHANASTSAAESAMSEDLRFPVGRFQRPQSLSDAQRRAAIDTIAETPAKLRAAVRGLSETQLDTPYRPDGWTVRQVVHHVPDSHSNAYTRFKLALTEDTPDDQAVRRGCVGQARRRAIHADRDVARAARIAARSVGSPAALDHARRFRSSSSIHPENGTMNLHQLLALYAWHGDHHVAHVTNLRAAKRLGVITVTRQTERCHDLMHPL